MSDVKEMSSLLLDVQAVMTHCVLVQPAEKISAEFEVARATYSYRDQSESLVPILKRAAYGSLIW